MIGYFAFLHKFFPSFMNPDFNNVYQFTTEEFIRSFYDYPGGQPICYHFWFLRDWMLAGIISPLIYVGVKWGRSYLMLLMVALYIYNPSLYPYQAMLTFFSIGAGFAIHRYDFVELAGKYIKLSALLFGILVIVSSLKPEYGQNGISIITGAIVFIWLGSKFKLINRRLTGSVFFIYAFHAFPILVFNRAIVKILHPNGTLMWLGCYVVCFVMTLVLSLVFYIALKKFFPKLTTIITGGR